MATGLLIAGAVAEFLAIVALAAPDLIPYAERLSRWLTRQWLRLIVNPVRRLLGRPTVIIGQVAGAGAVGMAGSGMRIHGVSDEAAVEEKVAFLLARDQEQQEAIQRLGQRIDAVEADEQRRSAELRAEMQGHVDSALTAADARFRPLRIAGAVLLAIGLVLTTVANFV